MSKQFNFHEQLKKGLAAQTEFAENWGLEQLPGKKSDFLLKNGDRLELKTDSRASTATGNIFIERYSSLGKKTDGGPWQAAHHGSKWFVYQFTDKLFCFPTQDLLEFIGPRLSEYKERRINNGSYDTLGYLVPISAIEHLTTDLKIVIA